MTLTTAGKKLSPQKSFIFQKHRLKTNDCGGAPDGIFADMQSFAKIFVRPDSVKSPAGYRIGLDVRYAPK